MCFAQCLPANCGLIGVSWTVDAQGPLTKNLQQVEFLEEMAIDPCKSVLVTDPSHFNPAASIPITNQAEIRKYSSTKIH